MYEPPSAEGPSGCRETFVLTRAAFGVLFPPLLVIIAVLGAIAGAVVLFAVHPALALLPLFALGSGVYLWARWERNRFRSDR